MKRYKECGARRNIAVTESYEDWVTCTEPAGHDPVSGHYNESGVAWFGPTPEPIAEVWKSVEPEDLIGVEITMIMPEMPDMPDMQAPYDPTAPTADDFLWAYRFGAGTPRMVHTLESHEKSYEAMFGHPCDDPDCEFHHPEVREY